jgi:hypothetical protein
VTAEYEGRLFIDEEFREAFVQDVTAIPVARVTA